MNKDHFVKQTLRNIGEAIAQIQENLKQSKIASLKDQIEAIDRQQKVLSQYETLLDNENDAPDLYEDGF